MKKFLIYVKKIKGFDVEAAHVRQEIRHFLGIEAVTEVEIYNRYDLTGVSEEVFEKALTTIFSEPQCDVIYTTLPESDAFTFMSSYLRGQYDQRADSCCQCIQTIDPTATPVVKTSKVYRIFGEVAPHQQHLIRKHMINPIESEEVALDAQNLLDTTYQAPQPIQSIHDFTTYGHSELEAFRKVEGLAMSLDDLIYFQDYFKKEDRNPTYTELKVVDTYWSDHCRHTTFMTEITSIEIEESVLSQPIQGALNTYFKMRKALYTNKNKKVSLMDMATIIVKHLKAEGKLNHLVESAEINACTLETTIMVNDQEEKYLVLFKNETHNHPTEIEPFGGAATCLGGAIRDPLSGRAYVYQAMRVTGAGDVTMPLSETIPGKLPQRKISQTAANGYSSYGNQIGLATGEVKEYYHPGYVAKRLEVGAVVGALPSENARREEPTAGDVIILIGGPTGRDGCGGATGSSKEHTEESLMQCGSEVQKGNPVEERKLQRLFRNKTFTQCIKRCNDFGAGGVCVAIGEIAEGLVIDLDQVPVKYKGLDGSELAISESQERMAIAIEAKDLEKVIALCHEENLNAVQVATVTEEKKLVMLWQGEKVVVIDRAFLDSAGVTAKRCVKVSAPHFQENQTTVSEEVIDQMFKDLNLASQKGLGMQFDSTIGAGSVLMPYGGHNQLTKEIGMAAKIPVLHGETTATTLMTHGFDPYLSEASPYHGGVYAVLECLAKVVALGGDYKETYLSFQEYFERLGEDEEKWGKPFAALLGTLVAQKELQVAAIGGKDSMSGTFEQLNVPPTLIAFGCNVTDAKYVVSGSLKDTDSKLVYCHIPRNTVYMPDFEVAKATYDKIYDTMQRHQVKSSYTVGKGGMVYALVQMSIGNGIGAEVDLQSLGLYPFEAYYGDIILEVNKEVAKQLEDENFKVIGSTNKKSSLSIDGVTYDLKDLIEKHEKPLAKVFAVTEPVKEETKDATYSASKQLYVAKQKIAKPTVFIPVFPGTNCEYDMGRVFQKAGAQVCEVPFINRTAADVQQSLERMEKAIQQAQIIALPGGFSAGDEPDGSGKFIAAAFRNERIKEAIHKHLYVNDGLMIGICNGFQVLVKLGLLPFGEIRTLDEKSPTLTYNHIGKHVSTMATTKITSLQSPWLAGVELGDVHQIPVSHGEGRFVADQEVLANLAAKGQIFSQYASLEGEVVSEGSININGSMYNIEGLISQDGRILGKMGHSERLGDYVHKNIPGNKDQKLFISGVNYFK